MLVHSSVCSRVAGFLHANSLHYTLAPFTQTVSFMQARLSNCKQAVFVRTHTLLLCTLACCCFCTRTLLLLHTRAAVSAHARCCLCTRAHTRPCLQPYTHTHVLACSHTRTHASLLAAIHAHTRPCLQPYTHTRVLACSHTRTHTSLRHLHTLEHCDIYIHWFIAIALAILGFFALRHLRTLWFIAITLAILGFFASTWFV